MKVPKALTNTIDSFQKLPGIGPKSAQRLAFYLLHVPQSELDSFSDALSNLKKNTVLCETCKNVAEESPCPICADTSRDRKQILIVEQPLDILAFEKTGQYHGTYHVLHGAISPLDNIGPDELFVDDLFSRLKNSVVKEVVIATNPTMEGEATSMYITKKIKEFNKPNGHGIIITRLGVGIPTGAQLEFADETTLTQAFEGRKEL